MVILDTDTISLLERSDQPFGARVRDRLLQLRPEDYATTIISYEEQCRGWLSYLAKAKSMVEQIERYGRLGRQLGNYCSFTVLPFDERAAIEFQRLKSAKVRVGTMDLKIAAIVLAREATLLTRNLGHFIKVPGLKIEDWTRE
jgi:tRNA(fMet)-specific endonuclease VapC